MALLPQTPTVSPERRKAIAKAQFRARFLNRAAQQAKSLAASLNEAMGETWDPTEADGLTIQERFDALGELGAASFDVAAKTQALLAAVDPAFTPSVPPLAYAINTETGRVTIGA